MSTHGFFIGNKLISEVNPIVVSAAHETSLSGMYEYYMKRKTEHGTMYYFRGEMGKIQATFPPELILKRGQKYQLEWTTL